MTKTTFDMFDTMNVDIPWKLEQEFKTVMIKRSPKMKLKTAVIEAIELWIANESNKTARKP